MNQYSFIITKVRWHSHGSNFAFGTQPTRLYDEYENCTFNIFVTFPNSYQHAQHNTDHIGVDLS